ncbi:hypothetical protein [Haloferula rosea]|uniref:Uncharacterized protein n=1 Tax=Haloferula rosea TaxID=490093 RepID=A0A934RGK4_9BACT|nr:hypothetical protein [Haloferula rosea]MBK1828141.1 hypothetical protein [Haloferula rosea]
MPWEVVGEIPDVEDERTASEEAYRRLERLAREEAEYLRALFWCGGLASVGFSLSFVVHYLSVGVDLWEVARVALHLLGVLGTLCVLVFSIPTCVAVFLWLRAVIRRRRFSR